MRTFFMSFLIFNVSLFLGCSRDIDGPLVQDISPLPVIVEPPVFTCPSGFVAVPIEHDTVLSDFCVAEYEMKLSENNELVSSPSYTPLVRVSSLEAKSLCLGMNITNYSNAGLYDLISNKEWMELSRNIESVALNWSGGEVGVGCLFAGNTGEETDCSYRIGRADFGAERNPKAVHHLSNGEQVWDLASNVAEWVDWTTGGEFSESFKSCSGNIELFSLNCVDADPEDYLPYNPGAVFEDQYNSNIYIGRFLGGSGGSALRGGTYLTKKLSGLFTLITSFESDFVASGMGFRCVFRSND